MKEFTHTNTRVRQIDTTLPLKKEEIVFFDIETTGFSPIDTTLYLIGCGYFQNGTYHTIQWFGDSQDSEPEILYKFIDFIKHFKGMVHYNGTGFDIPYLIKKCHQYHIPVDFSGIESFDLYKIIKPLRHMLNLENYKQKTVEAFLDIPREDLYSGKNLIEVYHLYLKNHDPELENLLLLHNHEDILNLADILGVINYSCISDGHYTIQSMELHDSISYSGVMHKEIIIELELPVSVPKLLSFGNEHYYFTTYNNKVKIAIKAHTDELKYFYQNYRDYYYLPEEDRAIHKSVAFYVDKNFRTKAKAANCYGKKTGIFLPQYKEIMEPYFKIDYYDKISYFEYYDDFTENPSKIMDYVIHIFKTLLKIST